MLQRAHVVKAIGEFDQNDAKVGDHRQQHFAERLGLLRFFRDEVVARNFRDAVDQFRDVVAEVLLQRLFCCESVFQYIVQETHCNRRFVEPHVGEDVGDVERMDEIRLAGAAHLSSMLARRKDVSFLQELFVEVGLVAFDFVEDVLEADHCRTCNKPFIVAVPSCGPDIPVWPLARRQECLRHTCWSASCSPRPRRPGRPSGLC